MGQARVYQDDSGQWWVDYPSKNRMRAEARTCAGCGNEFVVPVRSAGRFCGHSCSGRWRAAQRTEFKRGPDSPHWKGGRTKPNKEGYVSVRITDPETGERRYVLEHRHVMEQHLGRKLESWETVHHGPGGKSDNRIENLELWASRHPKGQRVEDLIEFAVEILSEYAPDRLK